MLAAFSMLCISTARLAVYGVPTGQAGDPTAFVICPLVVTVLGQ